MTMEDVLHKIHEVGIIPVIRATHLDEAKRAVYAIFAGGIRIIEITMTVPNAPSMIEGLVRHYGDELLTGAGTVTNAGQAEICIDSGAQFLVSPGLSVPAVEVASKRGVVAIPGALTPTEVMASLDAGAKLIKIFPCGSAGGPSHIKSLKAPFPDTRLIPTGGVNLANAAQYFEVGSFALGVGADLVDLGAIRRNEAYRITETARKFIEVVRKARPEKA